MTRTVSKSPFAEKTPAAIREKWLLWQNEFDEKQTDRRSAEHNSPQKPTEMLNVPTFHHQRYDAVVKRMQSASKQTGAFTSVP